MGFFELRLPDFGPTDEGEKAEAKARQAACKGATADVEGVAVTAGRDGERDVDDRFLLHQSKEHHCSIQCTNQISRRRTRLTD